MAADRHFEIVVTSSYYTRERILRSQHCLKFSNRLFSTFWYTWTFVFQHFGWKLPIWAKFWEF